MIRFLGGLSLLFGSGISQISPIRDPAITIAPTVAPAFTIGTIGTIGPIAPVRTIGPIRTISPATVVINRTTTLITSSTATDSATDFSTDSATDSATEDTDITESSENLTLVYALVPTGILALLLVLLCIRRKRAINNNNVVNIDLNIENVLPNSNTIVKQPSVDSNRFSNHIYEEVNYEARYEMPTIVGTGTGVGTTKYENVFTGDKGPDNEYGSQVTTIV